MIEADEEGGLGRWWVDTRARKHKHTHTNTTHAAANESSSLTSSSFTARFNTKALTFWRTGHTHAQTLLISHLLLFESTHEKEVVALGPRFETAGDG